MSDAVVNLVPKSERCHLLFWSTSIMTRFPFSNAVTFENTTPLWSPIITGRRTQRKNRSYTSHLQHMTSSLPKKWNKLVSSCHNLPVGLWQQEAHIWSSFLTFLQWDTVFSYYWGRWGETEVIVFIYFFKDETKRKKTRKVDWNVLPPTELYLSNGPLLGDKLILKIRGHFLYLLTVHCRQFETQKKWYICTLRPLMWASAESFWSSFWQQSTLMTLWLFKLEPTKLL